MGRVLLREFQLRNSLKIVCGIGQDTTPPQRSLHDNNVSQNIEVFSQCWKRFMILDKGRMETFLLSAHSSSVYPLAFQSWGALLGTAIKEPIDKWIKRNGAEVTKALCLSHTKLPASSNNEGDLITSNQVSRLKYLHITTYYLCAK